MRNNHSTLITRRRFLKSAVATGGALAAVRIIPASALGKGGVVAPSERILMGGIGTGGRGSGDVGWMIGESDVQFLAVCDVSKTRRDAGKQIIDSRYGNTDCKTYGDIREFLSERSDVDAVLIATGDRWHALAAVLAMRSGKDVYCEKPACLTMAQGQAVVETARRYKRVYQTGAAAQRAQSHFRHRDGPFRPARQDSHGLCRLPMARRVSSSIGCPRSPCRPRKRWTGKCGLAPARGGHTTAGI